MNFQSILRPPYIIFPLLIIAGLILSYNLTGWLIEDDEGMFQYVSWRISEGEILYQDVLSEKPPVSLFAGALILRIFGHSAWALRFTSVLLALGTALAIYLFGSLVHNHSTGLIASLLFLFNPMIIWQARFFRPDIYLLFFAYAGLFCFWYGWHHRHPNITILAGILFGLATLSKLTGMFLIIPVVLFYYWARRQRANALPAKKLDTHILLWIIGLAIPTLLLLMHEAYGGGFISQTFGHHALASQKNSLLQAIYKNTILIYLYFLYHFLLTIPALFYLKIFKPFRTTNSGQVILSATILSLFPFLVIGRDVWFRHISMIFPALCLMAAATMVHLIRPSFRHLLVISGWVFLVLTVFWLPLYFNPNPVSFITSQEDGTAKLTKLIQEHTNSSDYIFADYAALNFHSHRLGPPGLTSIISGQATASGQISGTEVVNQLAEYQVKLVLEHIDGGVIQPHHLALLRERHIYEHYLQQHYRHLDTIDRAGQIFNVYLRQ